MIIYKLQVIYTYISYNKITYHIYKFIYKEPRKTKIVKTTNVNINTEEDSIQRPHCTYSFQVYIEYLPKKLPVANMRKFLNTINQSVICV